MSIEAMKQYMLDNVNEHLDRNGFLKLKSLVEETSMEFSVKDYSTMMDLAKQVEIEMVCGS